MHVLSTCDDEGFSCASRLQLISEAAQSVTDEQQIYWKKRSEQEMMEQEEEEEEGEFIEEMFHFLSAVFSLSQTSDFIDLH